MDPNGHVSQQGAGRLQPPLSLKESRIRRAFMVLGQGVRSSEIVYVSIMELAKEPNSGYLLREYPPEIGKARSFDHPTTNLRDPSR